MAGGAGAEPAGADADVVEVGGAVGVGLGPFACEGGAEAGGDDGGWLVGCLKRVGER